MVKDNRYERVHLHLVTSLLVLGILFFGISHALGALSLGALDSRSKAKAMPTQTISHVLAFQRDTNGATNWSQTDDLMRRAKNDNTKVILVLESARDDSWYAEGYRRREEDSTLSYPEYVRAIVGRYRDEPTLIGWKLTAAPNTRSRDEFVAALTAVIRSIDSNRPILEVVGAEL